MFGVRGGICGEPEVETVGEMERRDFLAPSRDFCALRDRFLIFIPRLRGEGLEVEICGL